jgi:cystathionine beta-synthase
MEENLDKNDVVVIIFHDHGSRYVGKIFSDDWMRERGFLEDELRITDLIASKEDKAFFAVQSHESVRKTMEMMKERDISQMPVVRNEAMVGSISEAQIIQHLLDQDSHTGTQAVEKIMGPPFPEVSIETPLSELRHLINRQNQAVIVKDKAGSLHIITQYDIIQNL